MYVPRLVYTPAEDTPAEDTPLLLCVTSFVSVELIDICRSRPFLGIVHQYFSLVRIAADPHAILGGSGLCTGTSASLRHKLQRLFACKESSLTVMPPVNDSLSILDIWAAHESVQQSRLNLKHVQTVHIQIKTRALRKYSHRGFLVTGVCSGRGKRLHSDK